MRKIFIKKDIFNILLLSPYPSIEVSTIPHPLRRMVPLSLQKGASFCKLIFFSAFVFLRFHKAEEVQHIIFISSDSHMKIS